jgi:hypothetical protein
MRTRGVTVTALGTLVLLAVLGGCVSQGASPTAEPPPGPQPSPTPVPPVDDRLRESFRRTDPAARKEGVLSATEAFLRSDAVGEMGDEDASAHFTTAAFSSERLIFPDPAFIRRREEWAVVGLPDGMGLFFYDLSAEPGTSPLELSPWTIGLSAVEVTWQRHAFGVSYTTIGSDDVARAHYVLVDRPEGDWRVAWLSDEEPDWWFNAYNAALSVAPDLSRLVVAGQARGTTEVFYEGEGTPRRDFGVEWVREEEDGGYRLALPVGAYPSRRAWLWRVARPSPYATLVEFVERLQSGSDDEDLAHLVTGPAVISAAKAFGLHLPGRQYEIVAYDQQAITFRDRQGVFIATFGQPESGDAPWPMSSLKPLGAAEPGPTPTTPPGG